jgi:GNAT superfamily N-acetyltransferase
MPVTIARTDAEIAACAAVMRQLRPHVPADEFVARVRLQQVQGYTLVSLVHEEAVVAVTGFRILENLYSGRVLYVDDLVTDEAHRSGGFGGVLFDWLVEEARRLKCQTLELDSGVQRFDAHRFYLTRRMVIASHHFRLPL